MCVRKKNVFVMLLYVCVSTDMCIVLECDCAGRVYLCGVRYMSVCVGVWVCGRGVIHVHCWAVNHSVHNAARQHIRQYERC